MQRSSIHLTNGLFFHNTFHPQIAIAQITIQAQSMLHTAVSAEATIQAFHARISAAEHNWHDEARVAQAKQEFQDLYTPCTSVSHYHDLQCGHRIQTEYTASCGIFCMHPVRSYPFLCPTCLIDVVRAEVALESLTLRTSDAMAIAGNGVTQEEKVRNIAETYVREMIKKGYRSCKAVPKLEEPRLQFFDQFMREDGYGGVEDEVGEKKVEKPYKRPGGTTHKKKLQVEERAEVSAHALGQRGLRDPVSINEVEYARSQISKGLDSNKHTQQSGHEIKVRRLEHSEDSHTGRLLEDEASEAVRMAIELFSLV